MSKFLKQVCTGYAWFLEIALSGKLACMCVSAPQALKSHSHEMKPE